MENFLVLTFLFAVGSAGGWVAELLFRRIVHKKWVNPGFLQGPYLPIYGFGVVALFLIAEIPLPVQSVWLKYFLQILLVCVCMTGIEYVGGLVFIKGMGLKLWDYSDRKGNIQGIICPLFSLIWTAVGAVYVLFCHSWVGSMVRWFTGNLYYSFFVGLFYGVFIADLIAAFKISDKIRKIAKEQKIVVKYEELKLKVKNYFAAEKLRYHFLHPLRASSDVLKRLVGKNADEPKTDEKREEDSSEEQNERNE